MAEHTKGELQITDTNKHGDYYIGNKDGYLAIVTPWINQSAEANAHRLVKCWNSHDDLLKICKRLRKVLNATGGDDEINATIEVADKIIAKAEKG